MPRFDHVAVVVDDLEAAAAFFLDIGFESEGTAVVEGEPVDRINGLDGVRAELHMVRAPDGSGRLELVKYHAPADDEVVQPWPANRLGLRHIAIEIDDVDATVALVHSKGFGTVGDVCDYEGWRLCYVRGPEGIIVEFAERIAHDDAS